MQHNRMHNISGRTIIIAYIFIFVLIIPILAAAHLAGYHTNADAADGTVSEYNSGWSLAGKDGSLLPVQLPYYDSSYKDAAITLVRTLNADECNDINYLMLDCYHASVMIKVDDEVRYDFYGEGELFSLAPSAYHFFRLDKGYAGKTLTVTLISHVRKYNGVIGNVYIGDRLTEVRKVVRERIVAIFSYIVLFSIAILFFFVWFFVELFAGKKRDDSMLYLSLTALFLFISGINDTRITQFVFSNLEGFCIFSYEVMFMLEMSVIMYFMCSRKTYIAKMTKRVAFIPILNFAVSNLLFFTGVLNLEDSLIITHICLIAIAVCEVMFDIKTRKVAMDRVGGKCVLIDASFAGFVFFAIMICIDIVRYYSGFNEDHAAFIRFGVIVFIMILGIEALRGRMDVKMIERESQEYKQLAMHDGLTNLSNRTAYQDKLSNLNASETGHRKTIIAMFDINDLKKFNDNIGHEAGDGYIKDCAYFINGFFRDFSTLFRIGGDEFAVICSLDDKKKFYNAYEEMQKRYAETDRKRINYAYGYAEFDETKDNDLYDTVRRADRQMYECKAKMKAAAAAAERLKEERKND